ncbi:hypothetical protein JHN55_28900 [Streptomyces sp. MBT56]|uniref:DUF6153 family protein n=1 Tax=unclassified Streptomyces TaxID=2593676 RepID=UPI00190AB350|nr:MULTISPECIES: DUF6153 family protein [unclassified Streptomyces]MBK3560476.1 hypothetical protein [Streptomyces sp. MBT56]MBK3600140.1 hypothetical protein [Streptomyces sp. MBT54]MBK3613498.1 hypothetical protein [Streptomyces sp. MBT98]MBK3633148.1 hypothetical protein [Streptomyces sp. MBT97]MBK6042586.1 hypothetical protein [Streptomyces sp. MBT55]
MTGSRRSTYRPAGRLFALLVLAVLIGVLGMHALPPGGAPAPAPGHDMAVAHIPASEQVSGACSHTEGGSRHLAHADSACAAAGVGSAYVPPALAGALPDAPAAASVLLSTVPASAAQGRAPPDLSELQLLRI